MDLGLAGKVAIITGGSEGIGKAAAMRLVAEGARVTIVARRGDVLQAACKEINGEAFPVAGDITEAETRERVVAATLERFGRIDILVNNAGTSAAKPFDAVGDEEWQADFDLKLWAAVRMIRAVVPEMRKSRGGRIVNVTNLAGRTPGASSMPTSVSRAAGIALTKALSKDLAKDNILVNTVCIGLIKSGQHEKRHARQSNEAPGETLDDFYRKQAAARAVPLGRVGEAHEAGDVIAFLVSGRASYITGVAINIDGGTSAVV
jgi:3-oxoacyl-[acyl-carrier protein] reductase